MYLDALVSVPFYADPEPLAPAPQPLHIFLGMNMTTIAVRKVSFFKTKWFTTSAHYLQGKIIRFGPLSALIIRKDVLLGEIGYSKPFLWVNINIAEGVPLRSS